MRKAEMQDMINTGNGQVRIIFLAPARGLIGLYYRILIYDSRLWYYAPHL